MDFLLVTIGSHGDVHPFVGIGRRLMQRGHRVRLATNAHFEPLVRAAGIDFIPMGTPAEYLELAENPDMWNARKAFDVVFHAIGDSLRRVYETVAQNLNHDTIAASSSLCLAVRVAEDKLQFPHATIHLAPSIFRTVHDVPKLPGLFMPSWLPKWFKRRMWDFGDRFVIDPVIEPNVNALRHELGLDPVRNVLRDWWHSPQLTIGMFPDWFGPPQPDWPKQVRLSGFGLYDERDIASLPAHLEHFLEAGDPPVAFTPGSAMFDGESFFRSVVDACARLKIRGVLLTRHREHLPDQLPPNVIHVDFAPFSALLPRIAAIVHHGGIGTSSQGLSAAVPALVTPMSHDQFDNAHRLQQLGVADVLPARKMNGRRLAVTLDRLLRSPQRRQRAQEVAGRFRNHDGIANACDLLESLDRPQAEVRMREPLASASILTT